MTYSAVVDSVLNSTIKSGLNGSIQLASQVIFGELDSVLTYEQKRCFLIAIEGMHYRDNRGQDHIRADFKLFEEGVELDAINGVRINLTTLCDCGLLAQLSHNPPRFAFTDAAAVPISNYFQLRDFYEGDGRAKISSDLSHKREVFTSLPVSARGFVQLMKSIQRRIYEGQTGNLLRFQDKDTHDYESTTRIVYCVQSETFLIDPAISIEVIPLEQIRVKVIVECYHLLAEQYFDYILEEINETWPTEAASVMHDNALAILRRGIAESFNIEELKDIAQDLGIDHEDISGSTRSAKVRELVEYARRYGLLEALLKRCEVLRPHAIWR